MPSILVEAGFISNKEEEEYMNSEAGQNEIVRNIASAIKQYMKAIESPARDGGNENSYNKPGVGILTHEGRRKIFT
jgi:hypothetical protein